MPKHCRIWLLLAAMLPAAVFFPQTSFAQAKGAKSPLKVKGITAPGKASLVSSPSYENNVKGPGRNSGRGKRWAAVEAEYATQPDWIDELTVTFHVLTKDDENLFHYFTTAVSYLNIAKGEHGACAMLPPSAVARYGTPCAYGVEFELGGKVVDGIASGIAKNTPWWTKLDSMKGLERHSGLLQDRSKTPFALSYIDEYEAVR